MLAPLENKRACVILVAVKPAKARDFQALGLFCSDGISDVSPEAQAEWTKRRAERGMRAYGALIGANQGEALLAEISDAVFRLDDI